MNIWVDADACPLAIKEILYRAAERAQVPMTLVANKALGVPRSPWIRALQVARGFDVADNEIAKRLEQGDLVITADIPLAADGELYAPENIRERLATRDFLEKLRETGVQIGGPAALDNTDRKCFATRPVADQTQGCAPALRDSPRSPYPSPPYPTSHRQLPPLRLERRPSPLN